MTEEGDSTSLAAELRALYERAGSPLYSALTRQAAEQKPTVNLTAQSLSDWINGVSVPSKPAAFAFLIDQLQQRARRKHPDSPIRSGRWWEELRSAAERKKRASQGRKSATRRPRKDPHVPSGGRRPWMAPALERMVERPELERQLVEALIETEASEVTLTTTLHGAGGFGKTRLAAWVCHHHEIAQRYPGGLLWVAVGQGVRDADLALRINDISFALSGERPALSSPQAAGAELGRLLDERPPVLLVIDDVWEETQLSPFRIGGRSCTRLVTTRNLDLLPGTGKRIHVDAMSTEQALRLVSFGLNGLPQDKLDHLVQLSGKWPVLLNLINGVLSRRIDRGQQPEAAAAETIYQLVQYGPGAFDLNRPAERSHAVAATIEASLSLLDHASKKCYFDLAVIPDDVDVPLNVLTLLWPGQRADRLCEELVSLGLAANYRLDPPQPRLVIHDVIHSYLRSQCDEEQRIAMHRRLIDIAATLLPDAENSSSWWLLPETYDYFWLHTPYHLHEMAATDQLAALVSDLRWIEAKTRRLNSVVPVLADLALLKTPFTETLRQHLDLAASLLGPIEPPAALGATLASRLVGVPALETAVIQYRLGLAQPRLEPNWPLPDQPRLGEPAPPGHTGGVTDCSFSPDGKLLVTASDDGTARIWSVPEGASLKVLAGHSGGLWGCEFSPCGGQVATCSTDRSVRVWDVATGNQVAVLRGHKDWVRSCAFSPNGSLLASASADHTVRLWDVTTGTEEAVLTGHVDEVRSCAFSPNGSLLASASADHTVRLWDVTTGTEEAVLTGNNGGSWSCAFSSDGRVLAAGSYGKVILWDLTNETQKVIQTGHDEVDDCDFTPDGAVLATASYGRVQLWQVDDGAEIASLKGHTGAVWGCSFSHDGALLATVSNDQTIRIWKVGEAAEHVVIVAARSKINSCSFSPDGSLLATTSYDSSVQLLQVADGGERMSLNGHSSRVISCNFSPDGELLATTSYGDVRLWQVNDGTELSRLLGHTDWVRSCAFSPNGSILATGGADRTIRLWDVARGEQLGVFSRHSSGVRSCVFSPDGEFLATGTADGAVTLWPLVDGRNKVQLVGHTSGVQSCVYSPDGELLATASGDRTVRLWRVKEGVQQAVLTGHISWADRCSFSPDGSLLATASNDQTLRLWDVVGGKCHCALRTGGPLTWVAWHPNGRKLCTVGAAGVYLLNYLP